MEDLGNILGYVRDSYGTISTKKVQRSLVL